MTPWSWEINVCVVPRGMFCLYTCIMQISTPKIHRREYPENHEEFGLQTLYNVSSIYVLESYKVWAQCDTMVLRKKNYRQFPTPPREGRRRISPKYVGGSIRRTMRSLDFKLCILFHLYKCLNPAKFELNMTLWCWDIDFLVFSRYISIMHKTTPKIHRRGYPGNHDELGLHTWHNVLSI